MRLTEKTEYGNYIYKDVLIDSGKEKTIFRYVQTPVGTKLGQLEDIEEELGIDLITLFKILDSKTFYIKDNWGNFETGFSQKESIQQIKIGNLGEYIEIFKGFKSKNKYENDLLNFKIRFGCCVETLNFKDYGKTWALTKEELL